MNQPQDRRLKWWIRIGAKVSFSCFSIGAVGFFAAAEFISSFANIAAAFIAWNSIKWMKAYLKTPSGIRQFGDRLWEPSNMQP
jgi:hypothetical protein